MTHSRSPPKKYVSCAEKMIIHDIHLTLWKRLKLQMSKVWIFHTVKLNVYAQCPVNTQFVNVLICVYLWRPYLCIYKIVFQGFSYEKKSDISVSYIAMNNPVQHVGVKGIQAICHHRQSPAIGEIVNILFTDLYKMYRTCTRPSVWCQT